ncbi:MAG: bifunctional uridylyltransferase/uridylyl-removing protein, partial [Sphingomonadales bacterium]|nr:bifunctional uridylyltransferase/uridylyl-removing protein [Sphingomonadales bacterium]
VQDDEGHAFSDAKKLTALHQRIVDVLEGNVDLKDLLDRKSLVPDRTEVFTVEPFVVFDNRASDRFTVMETNARDREGLLHDLTEVLFKNRVSVESAHVSTFGVRAVDVFYLSELDGRKITNDRRLKSLEAKILKTAGGSS